MRNKKGFTLIELLVVIAIIGLLSTLAVVSLNGARSKARDARRTSDMKAIQSAIELYISDNNDALFALPATWAAASTVLAAYLPSGMPTDPADTVYSICVDTTTDKYLVNGTLENNAVSPGVISNVDWLATDCRNEAAAQVLPVCNATTGFCLGYPSKA